MSRDLSRPAFRTAVALVSFTPVILVTTQIPIETQPLPLILMLAENKDRTAIHRQRRPGNDKFEVGLEARGVGNGGVYDED
ncbi:hypothetical protein R3P38DRAFT_2974752 [Favolaschia claudopus]|uniref:Secreted protein n=1 Tax=Favolaschia claudopus TaxID=2862362 RepID=A0AAW0B0V4_9AGAR